ncbi:MAG TPA: energy transducer TonB, partial [Bacteroidota bacterium]|nr:energy transducer TonB [Bacteroidota bacterium]
ARRMGAQGTIWVKCWIDQAGNVKKAIIIESNQPIFNEPVMKAVTQYKFRPALSKGKPVDAWVTIPFAFRINK